MRPKTRRFGRIFCLIRDFRQLDLKAGRAVLYGSGATHNLGAMQHWRHFTAYLVVPFFKK